jgi:hypothetical protein
MRLLRYTDTGELEFTQFADEAVPAYAILSHTWGENEVTFADLVNGTAKDKAG